MMLDCCRIVVKGAGKCSYTVDYALVYIASTNGLLKKAIERGEGSLAPVVWHGQEGTCGSQMPCKPLHLAAY